MELYQKYLVSKRSDPLRFNRSASMLPCTIFSVSLYSHVCLPFSSSFFFFYEDRRQSSITNDRAYSQIPFFESLALPDVGAPFRLRQSVSLYHNTKAVAPLLYLRVFCW